MDSALKRLEDLLIQRSQEGLDNAETTELEALLEKFPDIDAAAFDRVIASIFVARASVAEPMPAELYARIEKSGEEFVTAMRAQPSISAHAADPHRRLRSERTAASSRRRGRPAGASLPWLLAAASFAFAIISWWPQLELAAPPQADPLAQRAALLERGGRLESWTVTEDPTATSASGDIIWDPERQEGYMRFSRLAANDPDEFQYQLWIFDAERDERFPVDGGVFDIPPSSEDIVIPIRASVPVGKAVLFAITVERPGGVVVSDRDRIALVADFGQA